MPDWIITPWRTHADLLKIRSQLYRLDKDAQDDRAYAVSRVMAWRMRGHLPHAVESTALLVDAFLHHDIAANSSFSVRAVYSAAFCRFVTGFCDIGRGRERTLEQSSMSVMARQIGMPDSFVAIRHEATHEELPGEAKIVAACEEALQWLWNIYWSRIDGPPQASAATAQSTRTQESVELAQRLFKQYRSAKKAAISKPKAATAEVAQILATSVDLLVDSCSNNAASQQAVADVIVKKNWLVPSDRILSSPMKGAFALWDDLLLRLCSAQPGFVDCLTASFLRAIDGSEGGSDPRREAYTYWLERLSTSDDWIAGRTTSMGDLKNAIMKHCCLHPCTWTSSLAKTLLQTGDQAFREQWQLFVEVMESAVDSTDAAVLASNVDAMDESQGDVIAADVTHAAGWYRAVLPPVGPIGVIAV